ncbi:hypothetical protein HYH03_000566 [Edaphochlamys debaryana]|uniref:Uncharacterized protein n=1 Tax=Edaphochlamys debaryana TaxID=47281 RepID=A0A835YIY0_9CHLO|nr:hypothetical protein HYH03_000566 [Edaphochlamys debaryana]|eukprot:KAG2502073.1 hypothetical protein HYH03_000566 [Edaphochlamys debaryana]
MESQDVEAAARQAQREAEARELKRRQMMERAIKRAGVLTTTLRRFVAEWNAARLKEIEAARLAAMAGKKKKRRGKKAAAKDAGDKDKKKKKPKTPVAEAWANLMTALDELVNKNKRVSLEDFYRGAELLAPQELLALRNIMAAANKKVFPTAGMNVTQLAIKDALWASAAAHEYQSVDRVAAAPPMAMGGLTAMRDRGVGAKQITELGYREGDLLRAGFPLAEVVEVAVHQPGRLRAAGLSVGDIVEGAGGPAALPADLQGFRGVQKLRAAGYSAAEVVAGGLDNAWDLRRAGYTASEALAAGVPPDSLRPAGWGLPELQPPSFLGPAVAAVQGADPRLLPPCLEGTRGGIWPRLLAPQVPALALRGEHGTGRHASGTGTGAATSRLGVTLRGRPGTALSAASGPAAAAASPATTQSGGAPEAHLPPRPTVAWPESGPGGASRGSQAGSLPAAQGVSRTGSLTGSGRSGG